MPFCPITLPLADVSAALTLSSEPGWNQTTADWAVFIEHGTVFGLKESGTLIATSAILPYTNFGFISMVLVTESWRKRGLATQLLEKAIMALSARGLVPVLDATPAGAIVYARHGFQSVFNLCRWERRGPSSVSEPALQSIIRAVGMNELDTLALLDREAFGSDRRFLLRAFLQRAETRVLLSERGFVMARKGHRAMQLGPLVAASEAAAVELLAAAVAALDGPVFLDVAERWSELIHWLEANGFRRQRPFQRMILGDASTLGQDGRLMVTAGPEFG
jgi:GNAT superfamily N-acetyltransferase